MSEFPNPSNSFPAVVFFPQDNVIISPSGRLELRKVSSVIFPSLLTLSRQSGTLDTPVSTIPGAVGEIRMGVLDQSLDWIYAAGIRFQTNGVFLHGADSYIQFFSGGLAPGAVFMQGSPGGIVDMPKQGGAGVSFSAPLSVPDNTQVIVLWDSQALPGFVNNLVWQFLGDNTKLYALNGPAVNSNPVGFGEYVCSVTLLVNSAIASSLSIEVIDQLGAPVLSAVHAVPAGGTFSYACNGIFKGSQDLGDFWQVRLSNSLAPGDPAMTVTPGFANSRICIMKVA
jgi:hypothetical protein